MAEEKKEIKKVCKLDAKIKARWLGSIINAISRLNDEAIFNIKPNGIYIKQMDNAHVSLMSIDMKVEAFEGYEANSFEMALNLKKIETVLKLTKADDVVYLKIDSAKENCLWISFGNIKRRIGCIDADGMGDYKVLDFKPDVSATIKAEGLHISFKATEQIADFLQITANKGNLNISSEFDIDRVDINFNEGDNSLMNINAQKKTNAMYSTNFMKDLISPTASDTDVKLRFGENKPISIIYSIADDKINFSCMLAPRIETNE